MYSPFSGPMSRPAVLLTGREAGDWYRDTLAQLDPAGTFHMLQVDFEPINALLPNKLQEAAKLLEPYFEKLEQQKRPYILANITLHEAVQYFSFTPKYFISIQDILQQVLPQHSEKVIILGTKYTMNHSFIPSLIPNQIVKQLPSDIENEVEELRKLYNYNRDPKRSKQLFQDLQDFPQHHFMIACTELAMVLEDADPPTSFRFIHLPLLQCQSICIEH